MPRNLLKINHRILDANAALRRAGDMHGVADRLDRVSEDVEADADVADRGRCERGGAVTQALYSRDDVQILAPR